jgi:hypothetical protein
VTFFVRPWRTIIEGVVDLLSAAIIEDIILLVHDDVIFPPQPTLYIDQITKPLRDHKDIALCYGKVWDSYYHNINAHGAPPEFPGRELYPEQSSFQAVTVSAGFALKPFISTFANMKADYDFCKILSAGAWDRKLATLYYPTTDVLWHQKAGTVDHYYALPLVAQYIMGITKTTPRGNTYHQKWYEAYGETWAESVQRLGGLAEKFTADNASILKELKCSGST